MRDLALVAAGWLLVLAAVDSPPAAAEEAEPEPGRDWHVGLNLRPELGVHPVRLDGGLRRGRLDVFLAVDPWFWTDGVMDVDLVAAWWPSPGYALLAGWRPTSISLAGGRQFQEKLLLGAGAALPRFAASLRARVGVELSILLLKHGGDLPLDGPSWDRTIADHLNLGAYLRLEYASPY